MRRAEDDARKRQLADRGRVVARLQQARSAVPCAADPAPAAGKVGRWATSAMSGSAHPAGRPAPRAVPPKSRTCWWSRARRRGTRPHRRARAPIAAGAFVQHRRRHAAHAELARRIRGAAGSSRQIELSDRHLVLLDQPDRQPVRELSASGSAAASARPWSGLRRGAAIGFLRSERRGDRDDRKRRGDERARGAAHCLFSGTIDSSTRRSLGR